MTHFWDLGDGKRAGKITTIYDLIAVLSEPHVSIGTTDKGINKFYIDTDLGHYKFYNIQYDSEGLTLPPEIWSLLYSIGHLHLEQVVLWSKLLLKLRSLKNKGS